MGARRTILRGLGATLLLAGAAAAVVAATRYPPAAVDDGVDLLRSVQVPAGATTLVCPSQPALPDTGVAQDQDFAPDRAMAEARLALASFPRGGDAATEPGAGSFHPSLAAVAQGFAGGEATAVGVESFAAVASATIEPSGDEAALASGAGVWRLDAGDLRSLVASPCLAPASEVWLVGGATTIGRSAVLELTNAGQTTVTVGVEGWGPTGRVDLPLLTSVSLAPLSTTQVLLEANAMDLERLALHVTSTGGRVTATILDTALDGLTPRGVDLVVPTLAPATELVIPGVALGDAAATDAASAATLLRLANPGAESAIATVELVGADGVVVIPGAAGITIDAGAVFDISLAGLPAGDHAVRVRSDRPLTGAVQTARSATSTDGVAGDGAAAIDRAWSVATAAATTGSMVIPGLDGPVTAARLLLTNAGGDDAVVRLTPYAADGVAAAVREVRVPAGGTVSADLAGTFALVLDSTQPVHAAAVLSAAAADGELIAVLPLTVDANVRQTVEVLVTGR